MTSGPVPGTPARLTRSSGTESPTTETSWAISRGLLVAATAAFHGAVLATVPAPGPSLPAEAETKIPASYAARKAASTTLFQGLSGPEIE